MPSFPDHFSGAANRYAAYRPSYPSQLYAWLGEQVPRGVRAWDCGTGNGQAALALRAHVGEVIATDPSEAQLRQAPAMPGVSYMVCSAESSALADNSVGLVTVAQALHWFDLPRFYEEVRRVSGAGAVLAVWSYGLLSVDAEVDAMIGRFNTEVVGAYWPPERALVDARYANIAFPFEDISPPAFAMEARWTLSQLEGYLGTWSAVSRYSTVHGRSPVPSIIETLRPLWRIDDEARLVSWPLVIRIGRIS